MLYKIGDIVKLRHPSLELENNEAHLLILDIANLHRYLCFCLETGYTDNISERVIADISVEII